MRDLGSMQKDAVLNNPAHLVARIGLTRARHVKEVTVDGRNAARRGLAHSAGGLQTPVDGVLGEANFHRVLRLTEAQYVDRREHAKLPTVDCKYAEPILTCRSGCGRGVPRGDDY